MDRDAVEASAEERCSVWIRFRVVSTGDARSPLREVETQERMDKIIEQI